jgi:tRNA (cmo5U34)-methyltransferase
VENRFKASEAVNYDDAIKRRIPLYSEIQTLMASLLPFSKKDYIRVLDLGCGTGSTSIAILKEFPLARMTGIDSSRDMLDIAAAKVKHTTWRVDFVRRDIRNFYPLPQGEGQGEGGFDAIVSAFSLHFLNEDEKRGIFSQCVAALKPGGMFIDAEAVLSSSEKVYTTYMERWKEFQRSNGFSDEEIGSHMLRFIRDVKPLTVEKQTGLMKDAGFVDVECYFKYMNWAVFGGCKGSKE